MRADGWERYLCHGVMGIDTPTLIHQNTLFMLGSVTQTYTVIAQMCLDAQGLVELDAPVHCYVPKLQLADEQAAAEISWLNAPNHIAGLDLELIVDTVKLKML